MEEPAKGYHRLYPGNMARLRYGYVVKCTGCEKDATGKVTAVLCEYLPDTKSGTPGADSVKVKGNLHWVSAAHAYTAEVRLYERLFSEEMPDAGGKDFLEALNPESLHVVTAYVEPSLAQARADERFQFERHGYFVADRVEHRTGGRLVFNRVTGLKDSWGK